MSFLVDIFGYLSILLHGSVLVTQSMALGGTIFLLCLARPLRNIVPASERLIPRTAALAGWSAAALAASETMNVVLQVAVIAATVSLPVSNVLSANFAVAGMVKVAAALLMAWLLLRRERTSGAILVGLGVVVLLAAVATTHAAARLTGNAVLLLAEGLHQLGAAIWIGGIPCFILALSRAVTTSDWREIGSRFSRISMVGVVCLLLSGLTMALFYIGSWQGLYGTAYGVMVMAKVGMFLMLIALGFGNLLVTERLRSSRDAPVLRLRRFAEVEIGIGITVLFTAASLTSVPPAIDLVQDRVSWQEIVARDLSPRLPTLRSPDYDKLGIPALQAQFDREAAVRRSKPMPAFIEGAGDLPPRNAEDIAWSEYNHHWAGIFVMAIGLMAGLNALGLRWCRHWPLLFLGLAAFLFLRSDPEVWPLGSIGFFSSLRDVEVVQHRLFVVLLAAFGWFEWRVRTGRDHRPGAALVFPILTAVGSALLLTHSHQIANVKDQLLIEITHTPLALTGIVAAWSRWLELRLSGRVARNAGFVWPVCFLIIGLLLFFYREA